MKLRAILVVWLIVMIPGLTPIKAQRKHEGTIEGDRVVRVTRRDAIQSIDKPKMVTVEVADRVIPDHAPVLGVHDGGHARAYPTWVLDDHEIVNDWLGDVPIAATW